MKVVIILVVFLVSGCIAAKRDYGTNFAHEPRSIEVVPA
jgi:hypothetical protein